MEKVVLTQVIPVINGKLLAGEIFPLQYIQGISVDSRKIQVGDLFFALPGERVDGHAFVADAFAAGAAAAVVLHNPEEGFFSGKSETVTERKTYPLIQVNNVLKALQELAAWYRNQFTLPSVGVTGSTGKTTTKDLIACVLGSHLKVLKTAGNHNNELGVPLTLLQLTKLHTALVVEMAMRGLGQIADLCRLVSPEIGVITNIGHAHQALLGTQANIALAKGELLEGLPAHGWAVLNADDAWQHTIIGKNKGSTLLYGINHPEAKVYAREIKLCGAAGSNFLVHSPAGEGQITLPIPGIHNIYNALAAISVGVLLDVPFTKIVAGLEKAQMPKMRLDLRPGHLGITLLNDCYNANPDSMLAALQVLISLEGKRTIAILGDMYELGDYTETGHLLIGKEVVRLGITYLITVGELAADIAVGARKAGMAAEKVSTVLDNQAAIDWVHTHAQPGDTVLVKGSRGRQMEEIIEALESIEKHEER